MSYKYEVKPDKSAFLYFPFFKGLIKWTILFLIFIAITGLSLWIIIPVIGVLFQLVRLWLRGIIYKKTKYTFLENKIIYNTGEIFSDRETELVMKNITHVKMTQPFIESKLYNTGHIRIEAAGSMFSEVIMSSINIPEKMFDYIQEMMKHNGFGLQKQKLIQEEKPNPIGVFFEIIKVNLSIVLFIIIFFSSIYSDHPDLLDTAKNYILVIVVLLSLGLIYLIIRNIFSFLDLSKRKYRIYEDIITYEEGFLTKHHAFIPIENLTDTSTTQSFIDRIFSLYDVKVSCQGSSQEISFKNMGNGVEMKANIKKQIEETPDVKPINTKDELDTRQENKVSKKEQKNELKTGKEAPKPPIHDRVFDKTYTAEFQMNMKKSLFWFWIIIPLSIILFPFLPFAIIGLIATIIDTRSRKFSINPSTVEENYKFINKKNTEFSMNKVMAVIFNKSIIDKIYDTFSVTFWSIGSSEDIKFKNIKEQEGMRQKMTAKIGIKPQKELYTIKSEFNMLDYIKASLYFMLVECILLIVILGMLVMVSYPSGLFFIVGIIILKVIGLILLILYKYKYYKRSKLELYEDYVHFTKGLFVIEDYYVPYDSIKDITTTKYPLSKRGNIKFDIAGEHVIKTKNGQTKISNNFQINYVGNIENKDELIDIILHKRPDNVTEIESQIDKYQAKNIIKAKPSLGNSLLPLIAISVIIFPLIPTLIITIPIAIITINARSYIIQDFRVNQKWGVIYKKQKTIVFSKIDYIKISQGAINKMFKNGNVDVNTLGSSLDEMNVKNIPNYREFYEELKKHY